MYLCVTYATFQKGCETAYQIIQIIKIPHVPMFLIQANMNRRNNKFILNCYPQKS